MKKLGIIVDGSSSLTKEEFKKYDVKRVYFRINDMLNNIEYKDDDSITTDIVDKEFEKDNFLKSSCVPLGEMMDVVDEMLKEYEEIIIFTIHKHISSQWSNCQIVKEEAPDRIFIQKGNLMNWETKKFIIMARELSNKGMKAKEIVELIDKESERTATIFTCNTWKGMTQGGRFSKLTGKILDKVKVHPIISLQHESPKFYGMSRDYYKVIDKMIEKFMKENDLKSLDDIEDFCLYSTGLDKDKEEYFLNHLSKKFNKPVEKIDVSSNPIVVYLQTAKNAYGIGIKMKEKK